MESARSLHPEGKITAMKRTITLSINTPCSEKLGSFASTDNGAFCDHCQKEVVDMTKMSDRELLKFLQSRTASSCVRLRKDQLRSYDLTATTATSSRRYIGFLRAMAASALLLFMSRQVSGQVKSTDKTEMVETSKGQEGKGLQDKSTLMTVTGKVVDETGAPMPGINIILENASVGTITNEDGMFTFPQQLKVGQTLLFSFVGYVTKTFTVKEGTDPVEVALKMDEFDVLGELTVDQPYTIEVKRNVWSRIKSLF